jgi:hypothetical protein
VLTWCVLGLGWVWNGAGGMCGREGRCCRDGALEAVLTNFFWLGFGGQRGGGDGHLKHGMMNDDSVLSLVALGGWGGDERHDVDVDVELSAFGGILRLVTLRYVPMFVPAVFSVLLSCSLPRTTRWLGIFTTYSPHSHLISCYQGTMADDGRGHK